MMQYSKPLGGVTDHVKALVIGAPGSGKTPFIATAPQKRAAVLLTEAGTLSVSSSTIPCWEVKNATQADQFFAWLFGPEPKPFDIFCIDSISNLSAIYLEHYKANTNNLMQAYGELAVTIVGICKALIAAPMHVVLTCKLKTKEGAGGVIIPSLCLDGQVLPTEVPGMFDLVCEVGRFVEYNPAELAIRTLCAHTYSGGVNCRDRSGRLAPFEPASIPHIFAKFLGRGAQPAQPQAQPQQPQQPQK